MLERGALAPAFDLPDQSGRRVRLDDYRGRWLALWWYPEAGSGGCSLQAASLAAKIAAFHDVDVAVVGISFNTVDQNDKFSCDYSVPFPLLSDADRSVGSAYDVVRRPDERFADKPRRETFIITPDGEIAFAELVPPDAVDNYADRLLGQLRTLLFPQPTP